MKLPGFIIRWLVRRTDRIIERRKPDFLIGRPDDVYLERWWVIPRNRVFNIYLHVFRRPDEDRALHDHPWFNLSILLKGSYLEHTIRQGGVHVVTQRNAGDFAFRSPWAAHRVDLFLDGVEGEKYLWRPCRTLFITGPNIRSWGFHCPRAGWVHWKDFTAPGAPGQVGRGCGEEDRARAA